MRARQSWTSCLGRERAGVERRVEVGDGGRVEVDGLAVRCGGWSGGERRGQHERKQECMHGACIFAEIEWSAKALAERSPEGFALHSRMFA